MFGLPSAHLWIAEELCTDAACQTIPLYNTVTIALLVVHYALMIAGVAYAALHRVVRATIAIVCQS